MFVFIAHAEADQAAADNLKAFLKLHGMVVEAETGERGFRHLQASDVVIALWSQKSVFATHRMQIERRMFEAWEGGRLVLVKLDHGFLPVGLRDLPAIDASFESNRQLAVWPAVERAAKEAMNRALVEKQRAEDDLGRLNSRYGDMKEAMEGGRGRQADVRPEAPVRRKENPWLAILIGLFGLVGVALIGAGIWAYLIDPEGTVRFVLPLAAIGAGTPEFEMTTLEAAIAGGALGAGLVLAVFAAIAGARRSSKRASASRGERAAPAAASVTAEAQPAPTAVFISYAHADDAVVQPVVKVVEANGRQVWIDKTGVHTGDGWAGEIVRAIKGAKGMMVMCSKQAFESDHIKREVYLADKYKKPMAPVFLEAAQPPEDFEYFFASVQWLELYKLPEAERPAAIGKALAAV